MASSAKGAGKMKMNWSPQNILITIRFVVEPRSPRGLFF